MSLFDLFDNSGFFNGKQDSSFDDIYRQYDESRRISEDIQQFHNEHPDADLTDHYSWEDILDAETDGYLDGDE